MNRLCHNLKRVLELNALETPDELQINTVMQRGTQQNPEQPKSTCQHCKNPGHYRNQCHQLKREKEQTQNNTNFVDNNNKKNQTNSNSNKKTPNSTNANNTKNQKARKRRPVYLICETCGRFNHSTEKFCFEAIAAHGPPLRDRRPDGQNQVQQRNAQNKQDVNVQAAAQPLN